MSTYEDQGHKSIPTYRVDLEWRVEQLEHDVQELRRAIDALTETIDRPSGARRLSKALANLATVPGYSVKA